MMDQTNSTQDNNNNNNDNNLDNEQSVQESYVRINDLDKKNNISKFKKFCYKMDIFAFLPIPKNQPVSTKKSFIASIIFLLLILSYGLYTFLSFLLNNTPIVSQYYIPLGTEIYDSPQFAVGFYEGDKQLISTEVDPSYFTIELYQQFREIGKLPDKHLINQVSGKNCNFDWLTYGDIDHIICPDYKKGVDLKIQGNQGFFEFKYPQVKVTICEKNCKTREEIIEKLSGGRIMLFLQNKAQKNYATGETLDDIKFTMYYYFLIIDDYNRYSVNYQVQQINTLPDYFTSFTSSQSFSYWIKDQVFYADQTIYDRGLSIWLTLTNEIQIINYAYNTSIVVGSLFGAFCSVLFTSFSLVCIKYNQYKFYGKHKNWDQFKIYEDDYKNKKSSLINQRTSEQNKNQNKNDQNQKQNFVKPKQQLDQPNLELTQSYQEQAKI